MAQAKYSIDDLNRIRHIVVTAGLIRGFDGQLGWVDLRVIMTDVIDQAIALMSEVPSEDDSEPDD